MRIIILEDDQRRRNAMVARLQDRFPGFEIEVFSATQPMIERLDMTGLNDVALMSLDHDLELQKGADGRWLDPGTGVDVAEWLAKSPVTCPVVVHTTNQQGGDVMKRLLDEAGWQTERTVPYGDLDWIDERWFPIARNAIVQKAPRSDRPVAGIRVLRWALLVSSSAEEFARCVFGILLSDYRQELMIQANDSQLSVELFVLSGDSSEWTVEVGSGPISATFLGPRAIAYELAELAAGKGCLTVDELDDQYQLGIAATLKDKGIRSVQLEIVEVQFPRRMQAVIAIASSKEALNAALQPVICELVQSIEIAVSIAVSWAARIDRSEQKELTDKDQAQ